MRDVSPCPARGTYTLVVWSYVSLTGTTDYTFNVQPTLDEGGSLTPGTLVSGSIDNLGQNDTYTFTLAAATRLWFDSQTNDSNLNWRLAGPTGSLFSPTAFDSDDHNLGLLQPGTYTLTVAASGDQTGAYAFQLLDFAAATTLTPGTPVSGTLDPSNSTNLYQFSGTVGSTFYFDNTSF